MMPMLYPNAMVQRSWQLGVHLQHTALRSSKGIGDANVLYRSRSVEMLAASDLFSEA